MANINPLFPLTPVIGMAQVSVANTARDGSGDVQDVVTGAAEGTRIGAIDVVAAGAVSDGMVRLFIHDGTNTRLWREIPVTTTSPTPPTPVFSFTLIIEEGLVLPANYVLRASTHVGEAINVFARAGNF